MAKLTRYISCKRTHPYFIGMVLIVVNLVNFVVNLVKAFSTLTMSSYARTALVVDELGSKFSNVHGMILYPKTVS